MMTLWVENTGLGYSESEATFFSRSSKSLRSTFEMRLSLMKRISSSIRATLFFNSATSVFRFVISILDKSDFLASWFTIPVRASSLVSRVSNFSLRSFRPSPKILNWLLRSSISAPTSVTVNLSDFFMLNIIIDMYFFVKQKVSGIVTVRQGSMGDVAEMMAVSPLVIERSLKSVTTAEVAATFRLREGDITQAKACDYRLSAQDKAGRSLKAATSACDYLAMPQPNDAVIIEGKICNEK